MSWSISAVSRLSKVSTRTLRHYDAIGLLSPAWTDASGRRFYEQDELVRLQQILVLRELGMGLRDVADVLGGTLPPLDALRRHHRWLGSERRRMDRLISSVAATIAAMEEGSELNANAMFDGFEHHPYEKEARERWGDEVVDDTARRIASWDEDEAELARTGYTQVHQRLAPLMDAGVAVGDPRVQEVIALHYRVTTLFWTPNEPAYIGLGQMYVEDERFHEAAGGGRPELVAYLRDAMTVYAHGNLAGSSS